MSKIKPTDKFLEIVDNLILYTIDIAKLGFPRRRTYVIKPEELGIVRMSTTINEEIMKLGDELNIETANQSGYYHVTIDLDVVRLSLKQATHLTKADKA